MSLTVVTLRGVFGGSIALVSVFTIELKDEGRHGQHTDARRHQSSSSSAPLTENFEIYIYIYIYIYTYILGLPRRSLRRPPWPLPCGPGLGPFLKCDHSANLKSRGYSWQDSLRYIQVA